STIGSVHIRHWDIGRPKKFIFRGRERPVENDAADGNLQRTQIPTAACKTLLGFAHFPQVRRRSLTTEHFSTAAIHLRNPEFLSEGWGVPQTSFDSMRKQEETLAQLDPFKQALRWQTPQLVPQALLLNS